MGHSFWIERWRAGQTAFHLDAPNPQLVRHALWMAPAPTRVLVPLCGKSVDLSWLAQQGNEVVGIEFVEEAARRYFAERGVVAEERRAGGHLVLRQGRVSIMVADILAAGVQALGPFGALYDRAALIALEPARHRAYLERLRRLSAPRARLLLVTAEHDLPAGPPFSITGAELERSSSGLFAAERVDVTDVLESEPRFRARGATRFHEEVWRAIAV
jgi:thiopurine S-methyltransferase